MKKIGRKRWAIAEGYIPSESEAPNPPHALVSHEAFCILNANRKVAKIKVMLYFKDKPPVGPYRITVAGQRTLHQRFNDLMDPAPVPRDTPYSSVIESNVPIVVQHTRLDSRPLDLALVSTIAYGSD